MKQNKSATGHEQSQIEKSILIEIFIKSNISPFCCDHDKPNSINHTTIKKKPNIIRYK